MTTFLKILAIVLIALYFSACGTRQVRQETKVEWDINTSDKDEVAKFVANYNECTDFAFKAKVQGSKYYESDIHTACLDRKGYKTRVVVVGNQ